MKKKGNETMSNTCRILTATMILLCAGVAARAGEEPAAAARKQVTAGPATTGPALSQVVSAMD